MKSIYLLSAPGGMYVNFLCSQLGRDDNYGNLPILINPMGKSQYSARQTEFHTYIKDNSTGLAFPQLTEEFKNNLYNYIQTKNIAVHTHYYQNDAIDLNQLKKVKMIVDEENFLIIYLMFLTKVCTRPVMINSEILANLAIKRPGMNVKPNQIINQLTLFAFEQNITPLDYVLNTYNQLMEIAVGTDPDRLPGWDHMNPNKLFFGSDSDIANEINVWQTYFDMAQPFDATVLRRYHIDNMNLIYDKFDQTYQDIKNNGWQQAITYFVNKHSMAVELL